MSYPFVKAKYFTDAKVTRRIDYIVLHDMEIAEAGDTAERCARYFQNPSSPSSCHYCVDSNSIVQCVAENDIAYHAPPNHHSIGIEHAGFARQTRAQWLDAYGKKMLALSAALCRELCEKYDIPMVFLSPADLRAGKRGITTHRNVSLAFGQSSHTDPGANFPIDYYMALLREDDEMQLTDKINVAGTEVGTATGATTVEVGDALRRMYEWTFRSQRDALVARSLAEAAAQAGRPLTAEETEAAVAAALAKNVLKVDISVAGAEG